jgi:hypothetical protein
MTQMTHFLISQAILATLWHFFLQDHLVTDQDRRDASKKIDKWFNKYF